MKFKLPKLHIKLYPNIHCKTMGNIGNMENTRNTENIENINDINYILNIFSKCIILNKITTPITYDELNKDIIYLTLTSINSISNENISLFEETICKHEIYNNNTFYYFKCLLFYYKKDYKELINFSMKHYDSTGHIQTLIGVYFNKIKSYDMMKIYYEIAIDLDNIYAIIILGNYYRIIENNYLIANKYYEKGVKLNNAICMYYIGEYYRI